MGRVLEGTRGERTMDSISGVSGPHYYVQGGTGLFYAAFRGRMDDALDAYQAEYASFERAARDAVLRAGTPYVSLFDMREVGALNAGFARWAMRSFRDPVYRPIARAMLVSGSRWAEAQARVLQLGTLGAVRVFTANDASEAVALLDAALPGVSSLLVETLRAGEARAAAV